MTIYKQQIFENSAVALVARVYDDEGELPQPYQVGSIVAKVYDLLTGTLISTTNHDPNTSIFGSLQTDARWTLDDDGYNLEIKLDGSNFPSGGTTYRVESRLTRWTNTERARRFTSYGI